MLPHKTLLVLGAGASRPYGFPTAADLRKLILAENSEAIFPFLVQMEFNSYDFSHSSGQNLHQYREWLLDSLAPQFGAAYIADFQERFRLSQIFSIDRFLADNQKDIPLGRAFIAAILLRCEKDNSLTGDWYATIFNDLVDTDPFKRDQHLSVVTFNYDRSFERFLYRSYFGLHGDDEAARQFLNQIEIVHVYGTLGPLFRHHNHPTDFVEYGQFRKMKKAADYIDLVRANATSNEQVRIKRMIKDAQRIIFLGFGFDPMNLDAIGLNRELGIPVHASCFNLPSRIMGSAPGRIASNFSWGDRSHKVSEFLHYSKALL